MVEQAQSMNLDQYKAQLVRKMQATGLPRQSWDSLIAYITVGRPPGDFLYHVLANDLMRAVMKADELNVQRLRDYAIFLDTCAPIGCYGSQAAVAEWTRTGGVVGRQVAANAIKTAPVE
jgi:hypothetical protein